MLRPSLRLIIASGERESNTRSPADKKAARINRIKIVKNEIYTLLRRANHQPHPVGIQTVRLHSVPIGFEL